MCSHTLVAVSSELFHFSVLQERKDHSLGEVVTEILHLPGNVTIPGDRMNLSFCLSSCVFFPFSSAKRSNWIYHNTWHDGSPEGCRTLLVYISEVTCVHCCFRDCITINVLPLHWVINWATKSDFYVGDPLCIFIFLFKYHRLLHILCIYCLLLLL